MSLTSPHPTKIERGAYSVIVFVDGDLAVAEDNVGTIIKEDSDAATVINAAINSLGDGTSKLGSISLKGTFNLSSSLTFPYYYVSGHHVGLILQGDGNDTVLNYTPITGYAISLSAEGATSDSRTCSNHLVQNLTIIAPNTTDGAILFEGATRNILSNIKIECANGNAIRMKKNTYGSECILDTFNKIDIHQNTKCCLYGTDTHSQAILNHCDFHIGNPDCIYFNEGLLWLNDTQVEGTTNAINRIGGKTVAVNLYNDGGDLLFNGGMFRAFAGNIPRFKPSNNCDYEISSSWNSGHLHINFPQIAPPYDFINRGIQCNIEIELSGMGTSVDDANASNGKANKNETASAKGYVFLHQYKNYHYLPRGSYLFLIRLKDTHSVANQVKVMVLNNTDATYPLQTFPTLTSNYKTYAFPFTINADDVLDEMRIGVYKNTVAQNTIYADFYKLIYLGTEWEDFTIGGGHQLLLVDDIGTFPTANVNYRGMLAYDHGATGVADTVKMCIKSAADAYSWITIAVG